MRDFAVPTYLFKGFRVQAFIIEHLKIETYQEKVQFLPQFFTTNWNKETERKNRNKVIWNFRYSCKLVISEAYSEPCQTSKMERFEKIVNSFHLLTVFAKRFIVDVWQSFKYASETPFNLQSYCYENNTQPAFTWSKLTIETLEQGMKVC